MIKLFSPTTTNFSTNGITTLSNPISCIITENLNADYGLILEYPIELPTLIDSIIPCSPTLLIGTFIIGQQGQANILPKSSYIEKDCIIYANGQAFRIYNVVRTIKSVKATCRHIFYDLLDNFLVNCNISNLTGLNALQFMLNNTLNPHSFTSNGDVSTMITQDFKLKNVVDSIVGSTSIVSICGGELYRDNYTIGLWKHRGKDNQVLIAGGKNLIGITETLDQDKVTTRLIPVGANNLMLPETYVDSPYINNYPHPKVKTISFSTITDVTSLRAAAVNYYATTYCDIPLLNENIDFIQLEKTEEYKNYAILQGVVVGDTVTVRFDKLNLDIKIEVIYIEYDCITNRIKKIEFGDYKPNMATTLSNTGNTLANVTNVDGSLNGAMITGIIDATKTTFQALSNSAETQVQKAILFEDNDINSPTYGSMCIGTSGFEIASVKTNGIWQYETFGTGKGFIANCIIAGQLLGGAVTFDLNAGTLKIIHTDGSYTLIDADGFNRYVAGTAMEYHYLMYIGQQELQSAGGTNDVYATINVPSEFIGKNWQVTATCSRFSYTNHMFVVVTVEADKLNSTQFQLDALINCDGSEPWDIKATYTIIA